MPIENIMLRERSYEPRGEEKCFDCAVYKNIQTGTIVCGEYAFDYAIEQCAEVVPIGFHKIEWTQEFRDMLVEWFYSGGEWKKEGE